MLSSIICSFEGGFSFSIAEDDVGGASSICIGSTSAGVDRLADSDVGLDFWIFKPAKEEGGLGTCEEPNSSATSFWCWLEDELEVGDDGPSACGAVAAACVLLLPDDVWRTLAAGGCCKLKKMCYVFMSKQRNKMR